MLREGERRGPRTAPLSPASLRGNGAGPAKPHAGQAGWILTIKMDFFVAMGFVRFGSESRPASRRYPLTGTMSRAIGQPD